MNAKLLDRDWRFITESLYYMYGAETISEFEKEALERIKVLVPSSHCLFMIINESFDKPTTFTNIVSVGEEARYLDEYLSGKYDHDPYFQYWDSFKRTSVFRDTDMMPESYRMNTPMYRDIYAKQGVHYALRIYSAHEGRIIGNISCFRPKPQGDFSDNEVEIARVLAPHIAQKLAFLLQQEPAKAFVADSVKAFDKYRLTPKEREVVGMVLNDMTDGEIADALSISRATLKTHIYNIYRKTGVKNRVQLIAFSRR